MKNTFEFIAYTFITIFLYSMSELIFDSILEKVRRSRSKLKRNKIIMLIEQNKIDCFNNYQEIRKAITAYNNCKQGEGPKLHDVILCLQAKSRELLEISCDLKKKIERYSNGR